MKRTLVALLMLCGALTLNKFMRTLLIGFCALGLFTGLAPKTAAQTTTTTLAAPTADLDWVWSDEYQCWVWNGPKFHGDYQGHSFFKEHFLNHQFFNFFENTPAILWWPMPTIQLKGIAKSCRYDYVSLPKPGPCFQETSAIHIG
jgi:hypothetical protein